MENYAVIDVNGLVVNVVLWDGVSEWTPGAGLRAIPNVGQQGSIGDTWNGTTFVSPTPA